MDVYCMIRLFGFPAIKNKKRYTSSEVVASKILPNKFDANGFAVCICVWNVIVYRNLDFRRSNLWTGMGNFQTSQRFDPGTRTQTFICESARCKLLSRAYVARITQKHILSIPTFRVDLCKHDGGNLEHPKRHTFQFIDNLGHLCRYLIWDSFFNLTVNY